MTRITQKQLDGLCGRLNRLTGSPLEPYTKQEDGSYKANIGNFHMDYAYGGCKIVRMDSDGGGVRNVTSGYRSKRETWEAGLAVAEGIQIAQEA